MYPEDDLAEEAEIDLPAEHLLRWDDNVERSIRTARRCRCRANDPSWRSGSSQRSPTRSSANWTSIEELDVAPVPSRADLLERYVFVPPPASPRLLDGRKSA